MSQNNTWQVISTDQISRWKSEQFQTVFDYVCQKRKPAT